MKTKSAILSAATLLAAIVLNPADATAESVATGCLAKTSGEIYSLKAYSSASAKKCRSGDQIVRVQLHQPGTSFAKRRGAGGKMLVLDEDNWIFGGMADDGSCELKLTELEADYDFIIVSVPPPEPSMFPYPGVQQGIREVVIVDLQSDENPPLDRETIETGNRLVRTHDFALMFHDVYVEHRGTGCFFAFVLEYAPSVDAFYDK